MWAAVITGPGSMVVEETPRPAVGPGQVRVKMKGCGVCASNLVPWAGPDWMRFPTEAGGLGHEGWGAVDAVGEGVRGLEPGMAVAALFYNSYAEYDVGDADAVVRLPGEFGERPFPGEPLGCAMNIFRRSGVKPGQTVAIVGIGFLGALLARLASIHGAKVIGLSRRRYALDMAKRAGATGTVPLEDRAAAVERVSELTDGKLCDVVIEATGKQGPLDLAAELVRERGRLVIAGYHQDGPRRVNMQLWNWRGIDVVNAHERDAAVYVRGMREAVAAVMAGELDPYPLFTHSFPLARLDEALNITRDRPDGFMKALVTIE